MIALASLLALLAAPGAVWYGPAAVSFDASFPENPYDPIANDVRVQFQLGGSPPVERLAYYDKGSWKAVLVAKRPGRYSAELFRNGKPAGAPSKRVELKAELADGYLRVNPATKRFQFDSGRAYWPLGHNLGWQDGDPKFPDMTAQLKQMGNAGANWSRIWACPWDGKNVYVPRDGKKLPLGEFDDRAIARWDQIVKAAEGSGIRFQFVLFHHGLFASTVNPNWPDHPWNAAKGGFLKNAADFFTDPTAIHLTKAWLRYAVARWGHSPSVMAWELFNEVEWVDARYQNRWKDITAWHAAMADHLRSLDPYGHLVTTSSATDQPALWAKMDYYQPHAYPPDVFSQVAGTTAPKDKPMFYGEFGPGDYVPDKERRVLRDGIWAALLSCHAGAAQYWYWDRMVRQDLYGEFRIASKVISGSGFASHPGMAPLALKVDAPMGADLEFGPGSGWGETKKFVFDLPQDATAANLSQLSGFFNSQIGGNKALFSKPLVFRFKASAPGIFRLRLGTLAKAGASLKVSVNGIQQIAKSWPGSDRDRPLNEAIEAKFTAGHVEIQLDSTGPDWVVLQSFSVGGISPMVRGYACGDGMRVIVRLTAAAGAKLPVSVSVGGLGLKNGPVTITRWNLDTGEEATSKSSVRSGALVDRLQVKEGDLALLIKR